MPSLESAWTTMTAGQRRAVVVVTGVVVVLALVDAVTGGIDGTAGWLNRFFTGHAFFTSALASFLLLLVAVFVFEAIERTESLRKQREDWLPFRPALIDDAMELIAEYRERSVLAALEEQFEHEASERPEDEIAREERDLDVEHNIMRGKALTAGQLPWDGRSEVAEQLRLVRDLGARVARLRGNWTTLLSFDEETTKLVTDLAAAFASQRSTLESYADSSWSVDLSHRAMVEAEDQLRDAETRIVERYALATGRTPASVRKMVEWGTQRYADQKLRARREPLYPPTTPLGRRPRPVDPDDVGPDADAGRRPNVAEDGGVDDGGPSDDTDIPY